MPDAQSQTPEQATRFDRWEHYSRRLDETYAGALSTPVELVSKVTGATIATYPSLAAAFEALPALPDGVKAGASLGWASPQAQQPPKR